MDDIDREREREGEREILMFRVTSLGTDTISHEVSPPHTPRPPPPLLQLVHHHTYIFFFARVVSHPLPAPCGRILSSRIGPTGTAPSSLHGDLDARQMGPCIQIE